jgi:beta-phosphoglucomutase
MLTPRPAFIFDLDGVIIDSEPIRTKCLLLYLEQHREALNVPGVWPSMQGWTNERIFGWLWGDTLGEQELSRHSAAHEALFQAMIEPHLGRYLKPGIVDFLSRWDHVPTGLASNAARASIDFILDGANLRARFDTIVDAREAGRPKPHPDIYLLAARRLGVAPADCIVFEDSPVGIAAAVTASMQVVAVQPEAAEPHAGALISIRSFLDPALETWLRTRGLQHNAQLQGA